MSNSIAYTKNYTSILDAAYQRASVSGCLTSGWRMVCAAMDEFAEFGDGQVGGFALGDFKVIHYEDEGMTGEEVATADTLKELVGTLLAFAGSRIETGGYSYYVVECRRCENFNGHVLHWELMVR